MADKTIDVSKQFEQLSRRIEKLEQSVRSGPGAYGDTKPSRAASTGDMGLGSCSLPKVPERIFSSEVSSYREGLLRYMGKKWVNGTKLHYYFFEDGHDQGDPSNLDLVREGFAAWEDVGIGIRFEEVDNIDEAEVRIGFRRGDGAWSYVGRDVIDIPGQHERTMNFGWDLRQDPRGGGVDTPIHEIGHTLGFPHEHQNPFSGIVWDEEAVYREFGMPPNRWSREQTFHNVLRKLDQAEVEGSNWDPNSIMHYSFGAGLIVEPAQFRNGLNPTDGLTETDKEEVRKFYPPLDKRRYKKLQPFELERLPLTPGEQRDFYIEPEKTDDFTIQTFGRSDSVMVLFEEIDGEDVFLAGDDDSGESTNAKISVRLIKGRRYILRIRLYLNWASGETAVMLWS
ncbi:Astacin (Peptidase family M12A) [Botrimarina colliarenosi]|uniref:Astacin (Peptidase family M12A) n=1 Tax=Botrimarina colliarenosi TaxID=2528001 RepID=A0A5C6A5X0_9BACT|nr:M12 family metallopeptidase [Botrimarina colliarenosi]TWT94765.1 Astacin (Peptidase family M12A) [Botrimarina colliarenosi]